MSISLTFNQEAEFVSALDKDTKNPTVFLIKPLSVGDKIELMTGFIGDDGKPDISKLQKQAPDIVKKGLKAIKNIYSKKEKKHIDIEAVDDDVLEMLPPAVISEVASKIISLNFLTEQEEKN